MLLFQLQGSDDRPIYARIAEQIKFAVASGVLRPGDLIPSVRDLSRQMVVNPNTVARAYRDLQQEKIVEPVRGTGLQVAQGAAEVCRELRKAIVRDRIRAAIQEARQTALEPNEIEAILRDEWTRSDGAPH